MIETTIMSPYTTASATTTSTSCYTIDEDGNLITERVAATLATTASSATINAYQDHQMEKIKEKYSAMSTADIYADSFSEEELVKALQECDLLAQEIDQQETSKMI